MALLRIEVSPIQVMNLGYFRMDHLNLALQPTLIDHRQQYWRVMEGGFDLSPTAGRILTVFGESGRHTFAKEYGLLGAELAAEIGTPAQRNSTIIEPVSGENIWWTFQPHAVAINEEFFPYIAYGLPTSATPTVNSSSVVASLLFYGGVDIRDWNPIGFLRFSPGTTTLLGDRAGQTLATNENFDTLMGGGGDDILVGSDLHWIEKLYGGREKDVFIWSPGFNIYHGGQPRLEYILDGNDTVNYTGVGKVYIRFNEAAVPHKTPDFYALRGDGVDWLYSIEDLTWDARSDHVIFDDNVGHADKLPMLKLNGQESGLGDKVSYEDNSHGMFINSSRDGQYLYATDLTSANRDNGMWIEGAEWLVGSRGNDTIYATAGLHGIEGGAGNDLIDTIGAYEFVGESPLGFDIEVDGGSGNDIIVANYGRSQLTGGEGSDIFVVSTLSWSGDLVECVITDADATDSLFVPYGFFDDTDSQIDGSQLMQILGGISQIGKGSFEDLNQNSGTWMSNVANANNIVQFQHQTQEQLWNRQHGDNYFEGAIFFDRDGDDLLIHLFDGTVTRVDDPGIPEDNVPPQTYYISAFFGATEMIVRVNDFEEGDLGIHFYDPGDYEVVSHNGNLVYGQPNWNAAVEAITNGGSFMEPLPLPPVFPEYQPPGNEEDLIAELNGDDGANVIVSLDTPSNVDGGGGDDNITTGQGSDTLTGGTGNDTLTGGRGNDVYFVESTADKINENSGEGFDQVYATINFELSSHVEYLDLLGSAGTGTGNDQDNRLTGNDLNNTLIGKGGSDKLIGETGNDVLVGGSGNDFYFYTLGDGDDRIVDASGTKDSLILLGINSGDVRFFIRASAPNDIVMSIEGGGTIVLENMLTEGESGLERIVFDDQIEMLKVDMVALALSAPMTLNDAPQATRDTGLAMYSGTWAFPIAAFLENDRDSDGGTLAIANVTATSPGITVTLNAEGNIVVTTPEGYSGPADFRYTLSDGQGGTDEATVEIDVILNHRPVINGSVSNQSIEEEVPLIYQVPATLFADADNDELFVSATLSDGAPLPAWLLFDPETGQFTGTPPAGSAGSLTIHLKGSDGIASVTTTFDITIISTANIIAGDAKANLLIGTGERDQISGLAGNDVMVGNAGNDTFVINGSQGRDVLIGGDGFDTISGGSTDDIIDLANSISNLGGIEAINGGGGNDVILLGDRVRFAASAATYVKAPTNSTAYTVDFTGITLTSIELIDAGTGNDTVTGSAGDDVIRGGLGDDMLAGGNGDDQFQIIGSQGLDNFNGGAGYDKIVGSTVNDTLNINSNFVNIEGIDLGTGVDIIRLTTTGTVNLTNVTLSGVDLIEGGAGNNSITGSKGADIIKGGKGSDVLVGGDGDDQFLFDSSSGYDSIDGGLGFDTIAGTAGRDYVSLQGTLTSIERIDLGAGTDEIRMAPGGGVLDLSNTTVIEVELISGGTGNDQIHGSAGNDKIRGNAGADTFVFAGQFGDDVITDFGRGTNALPLLDLIDVRSFGFQSFADLQTHAHVDGADTVIDIEGHGSIRIKNTAITQLRADDFILA